MKSAREIADDLASSSNDYECAWRIQEAIQQAREDGARWAYENIIDRVGVAWEWELVPPSVDVRKVAP